MTIWLVVLLLGAAFYQALRRPMLRKLAIRDAARRPTETMLVIAGSLLGTAIITGSFVVGDTLDASIRATATTQLGPVDEAITVPDAERAFEATEAVGEAAGGDVDGVTFVVSAPAALYTDSSEPKAEPSARLLELDFEQASEFGGNSADTGLEGSTPGPGEIAINEDVAAALDVTEGDQINASLYGTELELEVSRILERRGLAGFWTGFQTVSPNGFVARGTIEDAFRESSSGEIVPPQYIVLVSNKGDIESGADLTGEVVSAIQPVFGDGIRIETLKEDRLDSAKEQGDQFAEFFLAIGAFALIAGILLLVQIFVMLAEERKSQLGMLRAVGMRRSDLIRSFYIQGAVYALPAGVLGTLMGIGVGWAIVKVAAPIFGGFGDFSLDLSFAMEWSSLVTGFCIGVIIAMLTVFLTSLRISRVNIIAAIRDLPEKMRAVARLHTAIFGSVAAVLGALIFIAGLINTDAWPGGIIGPALIAYGFVPAASRVVNRRRALIVASLVTLAWGVFGNTITDGQLFQSGDIFAFVLVGLILNISAVVLLTELQDNVGSLLHRFGASRLSLRLGLAYPLARRVRTGLTLGMFSLVIFTMVFISILSNVFGGQIDKTVEKEAGGYDILVDSLGSAPPSADQLASVEGVDRVATLRFGSARFTTSKITEPSFSTVSGIEQDFVAGGPPFIDDYLPEYESKRAVWQAIFDDPTKVIVPDFFLQSGGGPPQAIVEVGDDIEMIDPVTGASVQRQVIGFTTNDFSFSGVFMSVESLRESLGALAPPSRFYVSIEEGASANDIATTLQGEFITEGVEAVSFRSRIEDFQRGNLQFFRLMQGYLALGLAVGVAGIGVVMVRAVRERRRQVGVLRSLGFVPGMIARSFIIESAYTALAGVAVGTTLALITAQQLINNGDFGEGVEFIVPWGELAILATASLIGSLLATVWPARQAARVPPAVALRISD